MTGRWEMGQEHRGVEPIPDWLDQDLGHIAIAKELGITPMEVKSAPAHWVASALINLEAQGISAERRSKR